MSDRHILNLQCNDRPGLVSELAGVLARSGGNIADAQQFNDASNGRFFMRVEFTMPSGNLPELESHVRGSLASEALEWQLWPAD